MNGILNEIWNEILTELPVRLIAVWLLANVVLWFGYFFITRYLMRNKPVNEAIRANSKEPIMCKCKHCGHIISLKSIKDYLRLFNCSKCHGPIRIDDLFLEK